jgi:D-sedoheptulose 7-phosphate isomerase
MQGFDRDFIGDYMAESLAAMERFVRDPAHASVLGDMAEAVTSAIRKGHRLMIVGNGGSAADAQHIAGEFVSRLAYDRDPLPAIALTTDTTALTAIGNDFGFEFVFSRQVQALGRSGDVLLGISTSGESPNVLRALEAARSLGLRTLGFTGARQASIAGHCDFLLQAPATNTAVIQQIHITAAHILCALVERAICPAQVRDATYA